MEFYRHHPKGRTPNTSSTKPQRVEVGFKGPTPWVVGHDCDLRRIWSTVLDVTCCPERKSWPSFLWSEFLGMVEIKEGVPKA